MLKEGQSVEVIWGMLKGKKATVLELDNKRKAVIIHLDGTKIETEVGQMHVKAIEEVNPLDQFLNNWKEAATKFYRELRAEMKQVQNKEYEITKENLEMVIDSVGRRKYSDAKIERILKSDIPGYMVENYKIEIAHGHYAKWMSGKTIADVNFVTLINNEEELEVAMEAAAQDKKNMFIARVEKKAGKIVDMSGLTLGNDGSINGKVIGEDKTVTVKTTLAGGHTVQCLHFRVLVK